MRRDVVRRVSKGSRRSLSPAKAGGANKTGLTFICYGELAGQQPYEAWCTAHAGVHAVALETIAEDLGVPSHRVAGWLGLSRRAVARKVRMRRSFDVSDSERVLALARIIGQLVSASPSVDPRASILMLRWLGSWLERPLPALGGLPPCVLMDTAEGRQLVSLTLAQMVDGSYA